MYKYRKRPYFIIFNLMLCVFHCLLVLACPGKNLEVCPLHP